MVTIREVAEKAGVSVATVSYVLNEARKMRPETQRRVLLAAKELGYFPNNAARSLAVGRSSVIGLVVPDLGNPFFPEIAKAFQEAANLAGMEALVMNTNYDAQRTRGLLDSTNIVVTSDHGFSTETSELNLAALVAPFTGTMEDGSKDVVVAEGAIYLRSAAAKARLVDIVTTLQRRPEVGAIFTRPSSAGRWSWRRSAR